MQERGPQLSPRTREPAQSRESTPVSKPTAYPQAEHAQMVHIQGMPGYRVPAGMIPPPGLQQSGERGNTRTSPMPSPHPMRDATPPRIPEPGVMWPGVRAAIHSSQHSPGAPTSHASHPEQARQARPAPSQGPYRMTHPTHPTVIRNPQSESVPYSAASASSRQSEVAAAYQSREADMDPVKRALMHEQIREQKNRYGELQQRAAHLPQRQYPPPPPPPQSRETVSSPNHPPGMMPSTRPDTTADHGAPAAPPRHPERTTPAPEHHRPPGSSGPLTAAVLIDAIITQTISKTVTETGPRNTYGGHSIADSVDSNRTTSVAVDTSRMSSGDHQRSPPVNPRQKVLSQYQAEQRQEQERRESGAGKAPIPPSSSSGPAAPPGRGPPQPGQPGQWGVTASITKPCQPMICHRFP